MTAKTSETDTKRIYWIGGSKGGVGKSMLTMAVLDYLDSIGEKCLLIECDTEMSDAIKCARCYWATLKFDESSNA